MIRQASLSAGSDGDPVAYRRDSAALGDYVAAGLRGAEAETSDSRWRPPSLAVAEADLISCQELETGSRGFRFQIVVIDPETRSWWCSSVPGRRRATVVLPHGEWVWLGTFAGARIARVITSILAGAL